MLNYATYRLNSKWLNYDMLAVVKQAITNYSDDDDAMMNAQVTTILIYILALTLDMTAAVVYTEIPDRTSHHMDDDVHHFDRGVQVHEEEIFVNLTQVYYHLKQLMIVYHVYQLMVANKAQMKLISMQYRLLLIK